MRNTIYDIRYTIFRTKWGYFGLAGTEFGLLRTALPMSEPEKVKSQLFKNSSLVNQKSSIENRESSIQSRASRIEFDKTFFKITQEQITAYFEGAYVNFHRDIPIALDGFSSFASRALAACRDIKFGQTISYGRLAKKLGRPAAARAVGRALAKNPLPLIIPCHRVICDNGKIGGFSAMGGSDLKEKLLRHEQKSRR